MELVLTLALGLLVGALLGAGVMAVRADRVRRRDRIAVEAELQAARQRADRATGETQALRMKLAAAERSPVVATPTTAAAPIAPGPPEVPIVRDAPPPPITPPTTVVRPATPATAPARTGPARPRTRPADARTVEPARARSEAIPVTALTIRPPDPATAEPPGPAPRSPVLPSRPPATSELPDVAEPAPAAPPGPSTWLGTRAPNGTPYAEDDLERIHGVGPYLARRLRDEGIVTYRQIAAWDDDAMASMSRRIGSFPDRIRREDWPASARDLHAEVYGESLA